MNEQAKAVPRKRNSVFNDLAPDLANIAISFPALTEKCLKESGIDGPFRMGMLSIYFSLLENDNCIIKDLVDQLGIPNATMSGLLDKLEKSKIIERRPCPDDGRARRILLTDHGRSLEPTMRAAHQGANSVVQSGLTAAEVKELKRLLSVVRASTKVHLDEAE